MAVDEAGGVPPTREWMQAAQRALETDGILDGSPSKRHKVCICICTLMSQHTCTPKLLGESLSKDVPVRLRVSREYVRQARPRVLTQPRPRSSSDTTTHAVWRGREPVVVTAAEGGEENLTNMFPTFYQHLPCRVSTTNINICPSPNQLIYTSLYVTCLN